ncbi:MAG: DUF4255 domain-containing protein [Okeania sp. SIO3I5]|uniref:DUF4255 domain-containing protein n=1 Tax=Okeania sp. SIO3I5 TaxID=2607805 RepID=UPI0013B870EF|nr:DUF4255 domain-containing protein [Okeania sp. SIO3I5]NEQ37473.1 DUF4255 domain-containing protein [Okeania sp. SIO3I5]
MLQYLDDTLKSLLESEIQVLPSTGDTKITISFDTPYQGTIENKPAINCFLYDVRENLELRSSSWSVERQNNGKALKKRPPARIDCSYLITAWPQNEDDIQTEHELLGEVMKVLLRHRKIPETYVVENDFEGQEIPMRLISLRPSNVQSFGELWQAMGGKDGTKPKVVLHCTVTISVPVDEAGEEVALVGVAQPNSQ